uniref:(northern house mosquito) hypothetical protein n=1 Tax=Culex pipiens TaxID=7175 RepID=A0A8D8CH17_CULPI
MAVKRSVPLPTNRNVPLNQKSTTCCKTTVKTKEKVACVSHLSPTVEAFLSTVATRSSRSRSGPGRPGAERHPGRPRALSRRVRPALRAPWRRSFRSGTGPCAGYCSSFGRLRRRFRDLRWRRPWTR